MYYFDIELYCSVFNADVEVTPNANQQDHSHLSFLAQRGGG